MTTSDSAARPEVGFLRSVRRRSGARTTVGNRRRAIITMLVPFGLLFLLFYLAPTAYAMVSSLFSTVHKGLYGAPEIRFVGAANYLTALSDPAFGASVARVGIYAIGPTALMIVLAIFVALLIDARRPSRLTSAFRLASFAPYAVPGVVAAIMWGFLYGATTSPVLTVLAGWGIHLDPLGSSTVLWAIGNVTLWTYTGYNVLIFLSQLHAIDPAIYEAARIDGAGAFATAWRIKLPLLRPAIVLSVIFNIIGTVQLFTEPQTLRTITSSVTSSWTPTMLAYHAAASNDYGYASAVSIIIAVVAGACSFFVLRLGRSTVAS